MAAKPKRLKKTKLTDKEQSERFKSFAREVGADEGADVGVGGGVREVDDSRHGKHLLPPKRRVKHATK
jgi:hypothetical protein